MILDEQDPSKLAQIAETDSELVNVATPLIPEGGTFNLVINQFDSSLDYSNFSSIVLIGNNDDLEFFTGPDSNASSQVLDLVTEWVMTSGKLKLSVAEFLALGINIKLEGTDAEDAKLEIYGDFAEINNTALPIALSNFVTEGSYGIVDIEVEDDATTITANSVANSGILGSTIYGYQASYTHAVNTIDDNVTLFSGADDWIDIYFFDDLTAPSNIFSLGNVAGNIFEPGADAIDVSSATGIYTYEPETPISQDFSFISSGAVLGGNTNPSVNGNARVDIQIYDSTSSQIDFDGLLTFDSYGYDGIAEFSVLTPNSIATELDVYDFYGIPAQDEISWDDYLNTSRIPDSELFRFDSVKLFGPANELHQIWLDQQEGTASDRDAFVLERDAEPGDFFEGTAANDTRSGSSYDDLFYGFDGGDTLFGDNGDDILIGGWGDDLLSGGDGNDLISGNWDGIAIPGSSTDSDTIDGGEGDDELDGEHGDDSVSGVAVMMTFTAGPAQTHCAADWVMTGFMVKPARMKYTVRMATTTSLAITTQRVLAQSTVAQTLCSAVMVTTISMANLITTSYMAT